MLKELLIHLTMFLGSKRDHHPFFHCFFSPLVIDREGSHMTNGQPKEHLLVPIPSSPLHDAGCSENQRQAFTHRPTHQSARSASHHSPDQRASHSAPPEAVQPTTRSSVLDSFPLVPGSGPFCERAPTLMALLNRTLAPSSRTMGPPTSTRSHLILSRSPVAPTPYSPVSVAVPREPILQRREFAFYPRAIRFLGTGFFRGLGSRRVEEQGMSYFLYLAAWASGIPRA